MFNIYTFHIRIALQQKVLSDYSSEFERKKDIIACL